MHKFSYDWQKNYRKDKPGAVAVQHLQDFITKHLKYSTNEYQEVKKQTKKIDTSIVKQEKEQKTEEIKLKNEAKKTRSYKVKGSISLKNILSKQEKKCLEMAVNDNETFEPLTATEQRVFDLLIDGKSYIETSEEMDISITTVKTHVNAIFQKKQVTNLHQLVVNHYKKIINDLKNESTPTIDIKTTLIEMNKLFGSKKKGLKL